MLHGCETRTKRLTHDFSDACGDHGKQKYTQLGEALHNTTTSTTTTTYLLLLILIANLTAFPNRFSEEFLKMQDG